MICLFMISHTGLRTLKLIVCCLSALRTESCRSPFLRCQLVEQFECQNVLRSNR
jgi:hypothetical protein